MGEVLRSFGETPELTVARGRAASLVERARLNEAVRVITELEDEVSGMPIAGRFSTTRKMSEDTNAVLAKKNAIPPYRDMTEAEHKRATLLLALRDLKNDITLSISHLNEVVLDIEATKRD